MQPEILLFGKAGSGKDTVANFLVQNHQAVTLAMADPMKRLAAVVFDFTEDQLWGPSSSRNAVDPRFTFTDLEPHAGYPTSRTQSPNWDRADVQTSMLGYSVAKSWIEDVTKVPGPHWSANPYKQFMTWYSKLKELAYEAGGLTPRLVLQTLGTEWGRYVDDRIWIRNAQYAQRKLLYGGHTYDRTKGLVTGSPTKPYHLAVVTDGRFPNEAVEFNASGAKVIRVVDPEGEKGSAVAQAAGVKGHASETAQDTIPDWWFDTVIENDKSFGLAFLSEALDEVMMYLSATRVFRLETRTTRSGVPNDVGTAMKWAASGKKLGQ